MRTLFGKILLWFLGAMILTIAAVVMTTALTFAITEQRPPAFGGMIRMQIQNARQAYESGGPAALAQTLDRFRTAAPGQHYFTDAQGRDLVTGEDRSKLLKEGRKPPFIPFVRPHVIARPAHDEKYWMIVVLSRRESAFWFLQPWHLWIIGLVMLLSYALARHLAAPVRRLKNVVERFGKGDLSARVETKSADEVGQLATAFNQMADRTESLVLAQRRLLQDISHELRSPLARLNVAVELARSAPDPEPNLDRIQKEADRLNALVSELLEVTRAEADPAHRRVDPVRLDDVVSAVVEDCEIEASAVGCRIDLSNPPAITVPGDPELLRRAVENVVRNAIRHAPPASAVDVQVFEQDDRAHIRVRDTGPGVPPETLPLLFEPFYRVETDRGRSSGGVGLGLAIVKRAVNIHGGSVTAVNANPGLAVEITLPLLAPKPAAPIVEQPAVARS
jgi:two-component system sensor histidine kinase CpxA